MRKFAWLILAIVIGLSACQSVQSSVTILSDGKMYTLYSNERIPSTLLGQAKLTLAASDRILYLGKTISPDETLPESEAYTLVIRRAIELVINSPDGQKKLWSSALTVGQAMEEAGYPLNAADSLDPPSTTPLDTVEPSVPLIVNYQPSRELTVSIDGTRVSIHSSAGSVGQALADAGIPLVGLDSSLPAESAELPADGNIRVVRISESVALTEKALPFGTRTELSADLELDQQALLQGGEPGLAMTRVRSRSEDGVQVFQKSEGETIVRPAQDRILGIGTKIVIRTISVDGKTIEYYRALNLMTTSYSPCRSATPDGKCSYGTSSGLPVQRGTVAMVYSWYLAFGFDPLYIPGYGHATVGDVGGGAPPGNHYWVDLGWTDAEYQPMSGWTTVYFLTPVPKNIVYVLP